MGRRHEGGHPIFVSGIGSGSRTGPGVVTNVVVGVGAGSALVKIYDGTDATGTQILQLTATAAIHVRLDAVCKTGCFVDVSGGAAIVTVTYDS